MTGTSGTATPIAPGPQPASTPSIEELMAIYRTKYYRQGEPGWGPRMRLGFQYFSPDDYYEALVARHVTPGCIWADVGCGRDIFPHNPALAAELSARCGFLAGIDPSDNIKDNPFVSETFQGLVDDYVPSRQFDLVTLRMVAEHITTPERAMQSVARMLKPGGRLVLYTPYKWAVMSILASASPFWLHHPIKKILWGGESRDTFPTAYKLNTRRALRMHTGASGMKEALFTKLDDCRIFARFRALQYLELASQKALRSIGIGYPESCILAAFEKN